LYIFVDLDLVLFTITCDFAIF